MASDVRAGFTRRGLRLATGEELPLVSGALHYFRVPPARWGACLRALADLGLGIVETYVPWGVHEQPDGRVDFRSPGLDLGAFLDEAAALGLHAIVRPGPHINAELTGFGFPRRILLDPAIQARTGQGTPAWLPAPPRAFPLPSYASRRFQLETAAWLRAVGEVVAPRLHPRGPVVAIQVDNELQHFFRRGAYDLDYHPDALAWWAEDSGGQPAPRAWDPADEARCLAWVAWKHTYANRALAWLAEATRAAGLEAPFFHNFPPTDPTLVDVPGAEEALGGAVGLDFYHRRDEYAAVRRRALYLAGTARTLAYAPEVGCGGPLWLPPMTPADQEAVTLGLLMHGVRGLNFYMLVDRDRWYGAPIGVDGTVRPAMAAVVRRVLGALRASGLGALERRAPVGLVASRLHAELAAASSVADPVSPVVLELLGYGPAGAAELAAAPGARTHRLLEDDAARALDRAAIPYVLVDERLPLEALAAREALVLPTAGRVDRGLWRTLRAFAETGRRVVVVGARPVRDERGRPLGDDVTLPTGTIVLEEPGALGRVLAALRPADFVAADADDGDADGAGADVTRWDDAAGRARVVFVGNRRGEPRCARVLVPAGTTLVDLLGGAVLAEQGGAVPVELPGHGVRMFRVA